MRARRMPPLNALRAFEAAARHGSIKYAAEELCVTPSAISQQIKKLEEDLDAGLLVRGQNGITTSKPGKRLSASLATAFSQIRSAVDETFPLAGARCLEIACPPPFAGKFLTPRIGRFIAENPDIDVRFNVAFEKIDYSAHNIDVGVRLSTPEEPGMRSSEVFWEHKAPFATPDYLESRGISEIQEIERATLLEKDFGELMPHAPDWRGWFEHAGLEPSSNQRTINFQMHCDQAYDAAVAGTGMVLGEVINGSHLITSEKLTCPFGPVLPLGLGFRVVSDESVREDAAAATFRSWLESELRDAASLCESLR